MSEVWGHYTICEDDRRYAKCMYCGLRISRGGKSMTTTALKRHLKQHAGLIERQKVRECGQPLQIDVREELNAEEVDDTYLSASTPSTSSASVTPLSSPNSESTFFKEPKKLKSDAKQQTLKEAFYRYQKFKPGDRRSEMITKLIAQMICVDNQPFSLVEDKGFRALISHLEPRYTIPTRKHLSAFVIPNLYDQARSEVMNLLNSTHHVSITTDMWTSTANDSYMSITAHFVSDIHALKHLCLDVVPFPEVSHSGDNIKNFLVQCLEEWKIADKVSYVVCDNGRNIVAAVNSSPYQGVPCLAHTFQLTVKDGLLNQKAVNILAGLSRRIVGHFKHSCQATSVLKKCQKQLGMKVHRVIQDEPTRWDSTYLMFNRLLEQRNAITLAAADTKLPTELSMFQWDLMDDVASLMKIFQEATKTVSSEHVTTSEIIPIVNSTIEAIKNGSFVRAVGLKNELVSSLKLRYNDLETNEVYTTSTLLDPRLKGSCFKSADNLIQAKSKLLERMKQITLKDKSKVGVSKCE